MNDSQVAVTKVAGLLAAIIKSSRLVLTFHTAVRSAPAASIQVTFEGPDTPLLTAQNGELLHALEHIAAKLLRLEPEHHDRISFDAANFKANRDRAIQTAANTAVQQVRTSNQPFNFSPMNSRERRLLHLALHDSGLLAASAGEGPQRHVVLYPAKHPAAQTPASTQVPQHP